MIILDFRISIRSLEDKAFINTLVFYNKAGTQIMSARTVTPGKGHQFKYQLIINDALKDGKPYTSQLFYDKLSEIEKKNNYELLDKMGG